MTNPSPPPSPSSAESPPPAAPPPTVGPDQALLEDLTALGTRRQQRSTGTRLLIAALLVSFGCLAGSCMTRMLNPTPPPGAPVGAPATTSAPTP